MSSATIAYSHSGGFWKTKYSYISSWFGRVGKIFYSSEASSSSKAAWRHNSDSVQRTKFYSTDNSVSPIGSGISVSFNKNVSQNKIYKSLSVEGTSNISGVNSFVVNSDSSDKKSGSIGRLTNKGGILYGHIGSSSTYVDGSNISFVGTISSKAFRETSSKDVYFYITSNGPLKTNASSLYVIYDPGSDTWADLEGTLFTLTSVKKYGDHGTLVDEFVRTNGEVDLSAETTFATSISNGSEVRMTLQDVTTAYNVTQNITTSYGTGFDLPQLFEITPQEINGAPPRGQYAQVNISLGYEPYELFALNLNYEPTDLDHSK